MNDPVNQDAELSRILEKYKGLQIPEDVLVACRSTKEISYLVSQIDDLIVLCKSVGRIKPALLEQLQSQYPRKIVDNCIRSALLIGVESEKDKEVLDSDRLQLLKTTLHPFYTLGKLLWKGSYREESYTEADFKEQYKEWSALATVGFLILTVRASEVTSSLSAGSEPVEALDQLRIHSKRFSED